MTPAEQAAHRLGQQAGKKLCESGAPTPNRLDGIGKPHLAKAWRRGYMKAQADHRAAHVSKGSNVPRWQPLPAGN